MEESAVTDAQIGIPPLWNSTSDLRLKKRFYTYSLVEDIAFQSYVHIPNIHIT